MNVLRLAILIAVSIVPIAWASWKQLVERGREIKLSSDLLDIDPAYGTTVTADAVLLPDDIRQEFF